MVEIDIDGHRLRLTRAHYDNFVKRLSRRALVKFYRSLISGAESTVALSDKYVLSRERICQLYNEYVQPITGYDIWQRRIKMVAPPRAAPIGEMPPIVAEVMGRCRKHRLTCEPIEVKNHSYYQRAAILIESKLCVIAVARKPYKVQRADGKLPKYWHWNSCRDADFHLFRTPDGWYVTDKATIIKHSTGFFIPIARMENEPRGPTPRTDWGKHYEAWHIIKREVDHEEKRAEGSRDAGDGASDRGSADGANIFNAGEIQGTGRAGATT